MLNSKNFGLAGGIVWGVSVLLATWIALGTNYLDGFAQSLTNLYPGYTVSFGGSFVGAIFGFVDAFIGFYFFAWVYNKLGKKK